MVAGMKKTLILIGCLALAGCTFDHEAGMRALGNYAASGALNPHPTLVVLPPPRAPVSCSISANGRQMWCF